MNEKEEVTHLKDIIRNFRKANDGADLASLEGFLKESFNQIELLLSPA